jgi:hypothetical protein
MFVAAALPYANPFQMQFPPAASSFPTTHSNPVVPSQIDNEVNEFLDTVLDSPTKVPASTKVYTPTKPPRASSPLPSSTPRAPRAMLEQAGCLTPTKYTSTKPSPIGTTRTTPRVSPLKLGSVFYPSARLAKEPVLPRASDDCRGLTRAARPVPKSTSTPQCYNCLAQDHTTTECGVRCPHCKQDGHKPRHCNYRTLIDGTTVRNSFTIPGSQLRPDYIKKASNKTVGNCASRTVVDASTSHDGSEIRFRQRPHNTEEAKEKIDVRIAKPPRQPQVPMLRRQKKRYNLKTQSDVNSQPLGFKNERGESYLSLGERDRGREWEWDWDWERGGERQRWSREEEERARWRARRDRDMRRYH